MSDTKQSTLEYMGGDQARDSVDVLKPMWADAYSDPPYDYNDSDADEFVARFTRQSHQDGFRLITSRIDNQIVGFTYGMTFAPGRWWKGARNEPSPTLVNAPKFAVIELVVDRAHRGQGISRHLLEALLAERDEPLATLLAKPGAQAHSMYQRWGWSRVTIVQSYPHWPIDEAMILPLN